MSVRRGRLAGWATAAAVLLLTACGTGDSTAFLASQRTNQPPPPPGVQQVPPGGVQQVPPPGAQPPAPPAEVQLPSPAEIPTLGQPGELPEITLAPSGGEVIGGGGQDPERVTRTRAELPLAPPEHYDTTDGATGYKVLKLVMQFTGGAAAINYVDGVATCALQNGLFTFRAYGQKTPPPRPLRGWGYHAGGGVLVIAESALESTLEGCRREITGGGPGLPTPCAHLYRYTVAYPNGTTETYSALTFASHTHMCDSFEVVYGQRSAQKVF